MHTKGEEKVLPVSDSQKKAKNKWDAAHMSVLSCKARKDKVERFKAACKSAGTTPNAVFLEAMDAFIAEYSSEESPLD